MIIQQWHAGVEWLNILERQIIISVRHNSDRLFSSTLELKVVKHPDINYSGDTLYVLHQLKGFANKTFDKDYIEPILNALHSIGGINVLQDDQIQNLMEKFNNSSLDIEKLSNLELIPNVQGAYLAPGNVDVDIDDNEEIPF